MDHPTLHMLCGKIASGKSTLALALSEAERNVLISEDSWLGDLYGDQMSTIQDYVRHSAKLRKVVGPHVVALLNAGVSVVLDFPANTRETRQWMRGLINLTGAPHQLHVLTTPDEVCLARLRARNAGGEHPFVVTEDQFRIISKHFVAPSPDEEFNIVRRDQP